MRGRRETPRIWLGRAGLALAFLPYLALEGRAQEREALAPQAQQAATQTEAPWTVVQPEQELADLLDACAAILGIAIEYTRSEVQGPVTMRLSGPVTKEALWELANRALAGRGLTSVQMPGAQGSLSVVQLGQAASLARLEDRSLREARAGFVKVLAELTHDRAEGIAEAVKLVLSKSGAVSVFKDSNAILVSDLTPHVRQALSVIGRLDGAFEEMNVEEIEVKNTSAVALVALIERITNTKKAVFGEKPKGTVLAVPENKSVLLIAPALERDVWLDWIERFDKREALSTLNYVPRRFGVHETASLIEATIGKDGSQEGLRMVRDELTGTLVITATASQHLAIQDLFDRLESSEHGSRRPIRSFPIKNRGVEELRDLLQGMLDAGAMQGIPEVDTKAPTPKEPAATGATTPEKLQGVTGPLPTAPPPSRPVSSDELGDEVILTADKGTNRLIAMGNARVLEELGRLIEELDVRHSQVLVEALVVTLSETETRDFGIELQKVGTSGDVRYRLASLFGFGSADPETALGLPPASGTGFGGVVLDPGNFSAVVRALETINEGRSLTIPKVLVNNNEAAELNSVVQTPFASTNASTTVATTSFGGTLDAGTQISLTPQIAEGDQLVLSYTISLSSFVGDSADPALPPPRQENRLRSIVTIPDGYTVVVGGLEIASDSEASSELPWLGDIPLLGNLFTSRSKNHSKSRFYVFLKATVLRSQSFEDLRYRSEPAFELAGLDDGWPKLEPRIIR